MKVLIEVSRSSNCVRVEIVGKGNAVVSRRKERARWFYTVGCSKVKIEQEGEVSCAHNQGKFRPKVRETVAMREDYTLQHKGKFRPKRGGVNCKGRD